MLQMRGLIIGLLVLMLLGVQPAAAQEAPAQDVPTYTVQDGDTLYSIARAHGLSVEALRALNGLEGNLIQPGQVLRVASPPAPEAPEAPPLSDPPAVVNAPDPAAVPAAANSAAMRPQVPPPPEAPLPAADSTAAPAPPPEAAAPRLYGTHTVAEGQTLYSIAARYGVPADSLRRLNERTLPSYLKPGRLLRLPPSWGVPTHRVQEGETLYDLAGQYGVSVYTWRRVNDLEEDSTLAPGQVLRVPGRRAPDPPPAGTLPPPDARGPLAAYPASFAGRLMASGQPYDPAQLTVSHPELPFGAVVLLTNPANERRTFARVADRGPIDEASLMDASTAVLEALGLAPESRQPVAVRVVDRGEF